MRRMLTIVLAISLAGVLFPAIGHAQNVSASWPCTTGPTCNSGSIPNLDFTQIPEAPNYALMVQALKGTPKMTISSFTSAGDGQINSVGGTTACKTGLCIPTVAGGVMTGCWQGYCVGGLLPVSYPTVVNNNLNAYVGYDNDVSGNTPPPNGTFDDQLNFWFTPTGTDTDMAFDGVNMIISNGGDVSNKREPDGVGACQPNSTSPVTGKSDVLFQSYNLDGVNWRICAYQEDAAGGSEYVNFTNLSTSGEVENIDVAEFANFAIHYNWMSATWWLQNVAAFHESWQGVTPNELTVGLSVS